METSYERGFLLNSKKILAAAVSVAAIASLTACGGVKDRTGSVIALDPKTTVTESGFVKSRFLDDKAGSICLLTVLQAMKKENKKPEYDTDFYFTNYEEVGHGAATVGKDADELLAVDMGDRKSVV